MISLRSHAIYSDLFKSEDESPSVFLPQKETKFVFIVTQFCILLLNLNL